MQDKFKAYYFISLFSSCRCMSMYKSYMHFAKYYNPKLSGNIEESPGPTNRMYVDSSKNISAPYSQGCVATMCCNKFMFIN